MYYTEMGRASDVARASFDGGYTSLFSFVSVDRVHYRMSVHPLPAVATRIALFFPPPEDRSPTLVTARSSSDTRNTVIPKLTIRSLHRGFSYEVPVRGDLLFN